jgi:two-component system nitrate/nitrite sensor histidine kinase NarX
MLTRFGTQAGLKTEFSDAGTGVPLHAESQLQVLHILQEALSNVRKHASATRVGLTVHRDAVYRFAVSDDGRGFNVDAAPDATEAHIGLRIMRERAQRIGGNIELRSQPGSGTQVVLTLPAVQASGRKGKRGNEVHA